MDDWCRRIGIAEASGSVVDSNLLETPDLLKAPMVFWLIGATDGYTKNLSLFLRPKRRFSLTPIYDVHTAQTSLEARQIEKKKMKLAISIRISRHYVFDRNAGRHFRQTAKKEAGVPESLVEEAIEETRERAEPALLVVEMLMPGGFPEVIHAVVERGVQERLASLCSTV